MSGTFGRERREVSAPGVPMPGAANVPEVSARGAMWAIGEANAGIPKVMDVVGRIAEREATALSKQVGEERGASEELQRDADGRLVVPDLSRGMFPTAASEARREVLTSRYASELISDTQRDVARLRREANDDPEQFRESYTRYRNGVLSTIPEGVRAPFAQQLIRLGDQHYNSLIERRMAQEREEAATRAVNVVQLRAQDAHDLVMGGRDASEARSQALALLRANRNVIPPQAFVALERQIEVVGPATANLMRDARRSPASQGATIQALMTGPGAPGWRPEWSALTQEERQGMARLVSSIQGAARSDISWGQSQGDRAERNTAARIALRDAQIDSELSGLPPGSPQTGPLLEERARLRQQMETRAPRYAATFIRQNTAEDRVRRAAEASEAVGRMFVDRALAEQPGAGGPDQWVPADPRVQAILDLPQSVSTAQRAALLQQVQREQEAEARAARTEAAAMRPFMEAFAAAHSPADPSMSPAAQVSNGRENQARLLSVWSAQYGDDINAVPPDMWRRGAQMGVVPEQLSRMMSNAIASRDEGQLRRMASIHEAMVRDPNALQAYNQAVPERTRRALEVMRDVLETQPRRPEPTPDNPNPPVNGLVVRMAEAAERVMRGDPTMEQEARASMGGTRSEQDQSFAEARAAALQRAGVASMPASADRAYQGAFWTYLSMAPGDPGAAANRAMAEITRVWRPSRMGFEGMAVPNVRPGGIFSGPSADARLMPLPPEMHVVPEGRSGEPSTEWIGRLVRERLNENAGTRERPGQRTNPFSPQLGTNTFLRLSPDRNERGQPLYEVWRMLPDAGGMLIPQAVPLVRNGVATGANMTLDLFTEAESRRERWRSRYLPEAEERRQRSEEEATPALGPLGAVLGAVRAGPRPEPRQ